MSFNILVINGPNLNLLGSRETNIYGSFSLNTLEKTLKEYCDKKNIKLNFFQSNSESDIIESIHNSKKKCDGIIINPAAFTHTSIAIRDALSAVNLPTVEVHISNIYSREAFRHHSYIAPVCIGQLSGFGLQGYEFAVDALIKHLES